MVPGVAAGRERLWRDVSQLRLPNKRSPLPGEDGVVVASEYHKILIEHDIADVDVETRKSVRV